MDGEGSGNGGDVESSCDYKNAKVEQELKERLMWEILFNFFGAEI